jgi:NitT/TauT family transport system substrate-binding protein
MFFIASSAAQIFQRRSTRNTCLTKYAFGMFMLWCNVPQRNDNIWAARMRCTLEWGSIGMLRRVVRQLIIFWTLCNLTAVGLAAEPLVLALSRTPLSLPFFIAEKQGFFEAEGLPITIVEVIGGHRSLQQVLDGQADLATCSEAVVMFNSFKRDDFAILATFVSSADDVKLVAHPDSGISKAEDLANKKIGTIIGAASHYYLTSLALLSGVDPHSMKVVAVQPENMAKALKQREVDAIASWQPFAYQAEQATSGARVIPDGGFYTVAFNVVISRKLIGKRDDELAKLLRALVRAENYIAEQPKQAQAVLLNRLQLEQPYIDWLWPRYRYRLSLGQSLLTTLESEARWARAEGLVEASKSPNYLKFIHAGPLRKVRPTAVGINE